MSEMMERMRNRERVWQCLEKMIFMILSHNAWKILKQAQQKMKAFYRHR
jgi:phosphopantetheinyl transferase